MGKIQNILVKNEDDARKILGRDYHKLNSLDHMLKCHTESMGCNQTFCPECGYNVVHYNSCRDRNCPECQYGKCQEWVDTYQNYMIDGIEYFHIVFTLPGELNSLIYFNQSLLYSLMFKAASHALLRGAERKGYGRIGFSVILHTWSSSMAYHPHLHCIVSGGGITEDELGRQSFKKSSDKYFLPVKEMLSPMYRHAFLEGLKEIHGKLKFMDDDKDLENDSSFESFISSMYAKNWVVYSKPTFKNADAVINYIGRYTHRIAISNHRIVKYDDRSKTVTFTYKDYRDQSKQKEMTLTVKEFIRRFFLHVLPSRFIKIRHYGFMGNSVRKKLIPLVRKLVNAAVKASNAPVRRPHPLRKIKRVCRCPKCGAELESYMLSYGPPN